MKEKLNKNNLIGKGWQYSVYDLGNGRVYKKYNSKLESFQKCWFLFWKIPVILKEMRINAIRSFEFLNDFLIKNPKKAYLFGNFKLVNNLDFEQDKVISIKDYFKNHSIEENKIIIDKFVNLCSLFFSWGFMDKTLKIGKNFSINKKGEIILTDIGEIWFDKEEIKKQIKKEIWKDKWEIKDVPIKLQSYYIEKIEKVFLK